MTDPCNKGPDIDKLNDKVDSLSANLTNTSSDLKQAIDKLTSVIMADIETRAEVEQLKKDREITYGELRRIGVDVHEIKIRNAKCDGAGIFENFPVVWNYVQQEKGWRRLIPGVCAAICTIVAVMSFMASLPKANNHDHIPDPRGSVKQDVGIDRNQRH